MQRDELRRQGQPDARSLVRTTRRRDAMEALDNARDVRRRDADAGVFNSEEGVVLAILDEDADLALECVLESVADNVEADLWEDRPSRSDTADPRGSFRERKSGPTFSQSSESTYTNLSSLSSHSTTSSRPAFRMAPSKSAARPAVRRPS